MTCLEAYSLPRGRIGWKDFSEDLRGFGRPVRKIPVTPMMCVRMCVCAHDITLKYPSNPSNHFDQSDQRSKNGINLPTIERVFAPNSGRIAQIAMLPLEGRVLPARSRVDRAVSIADQTPRGGGSKVCSSHAEHRRIIERVCARNSEKLFYQEGDLMSAEEEFTDVVGDFAQLAIDKGVSIDAVINALVVTALTISIRRSGINGARLYISELVRSVDDSLLPPRVLQ